MEMERTVLQILQQLLANQAEMKADQTKAKAETKADHAKANQEDLLARMKETNANQENVEAIMSASMTSSEDLLIRMEARIETNRERDRDDSKGMIENERQDGRQTGRIEIHSLCHAVRVEGDQPA
jgi:hypothetical protein